MLRDTLVDKEEREPRKVLLVLDEALAVARPTLAREIEAYFNTHADALHLVAAPFVMEGGERTKNSYFHVSEVQSQIDRYPNKHSPLPWRTKVQKATWSQGQQEISFLLILTGKHGQDDF